MEDKLHPLTELMLARMKSHPEEFEDDILTYEARWDNAMHAIKKYGSDADKQAILEGMRPILLDAAHAQAMDELLNGEERRRKQREEEADYMAKMQTIQQQVVAQQSYQINSLATATGVSPTPNPKSLLGGIVNRSKP